MSDNQICNLFVGTDLVLIGRIEDLIQRYGERFTARVYTEREVADCGGRAASLAARWAAKEAVAKAFGTGIGAVGFREIEVLRAESGRPELQLHGAAAALARQQGLTTWAVSLSHDGGMALAFVVALAGDAPTVSADQPGVSKPLSQTEKRPQPLRALPMSGPAGPFQV